MENLNRNPENQWPPNAGIIVGKIVEAMNLRVGALSKRTARRYFRGKRIKEPQQNDILFDLSCVLFDSGMAAMPYALPEDFPFYGYLSGGLVAYTTRWDQILGFLRGKQLSIQRTDLASLACLRLAVIDMAIRVAAILELTQLLPPSEEVPLWAMEGGGSLYLKKLMDECGDKRPTRDQLVDRLYVSRNTVDSWLDSNVTPSHERIEKLADYISPLIPDGRAEEPLSSLRRHYTLCGLADMLADYLGRDAVIELAGAFQRFTRSILESLKQYRYLPREDWIEQKVWLFVWGSQHISTERILQSVIQRENDPVWQADLMAAHTRWKYRLHYVFRKIMELESQPGIDLAADLTILNQMLSKSLAYDFSDNISVTPGGPPDNGNLSSSSGTPSSILHHIAMYEQAMANDHPETAVHHARLATVLDPGNAEFHMKIGEALGEIGQVKEALDELRSAASICPKWEAPRVAMGAVFLDAHRHQEALKILERSAKELGDFTWDFAYHLGVARLWCKDIKGALEMFEYALERKPDHAFAIDLAADCYLKLGDRRRGRELSKQSNYLGVSGTHLGFQFGFYKDSNREQDTDIVGKPDDEARD